MAYTIPSDTNEYVKASIREVVVTLVEAIVLVFSCWVMVLLILAAQFERWSSPVAVILAAPFIATLFTLLFFRWIAGFGKRRSKRTHDDAGEIAQA